jgi:hypothetical protein
MALFFLIKITIYCVKIRDVLNLLTSLAEIQQGGKKH